MKSSPDPSVHRQREQQLIQHVERLLNDERLRVDTTRGNRSVTTLLRDVKKPDPAEKGVELKRMMSDLNLPDRELQNRMPLGESLDVTLYQTSWWVLKKAVGRMRVVCVSPTKALLRGESPQPMHTPELQKLLSTMPPPPPGGVPTTLVILSTSGFTIEAREVADRRPDRTVILVEPNDAGGWTAIGPAQTRAIADLFDPEAEEHKRKRVKDFIEANRSDLLTSGIAAERIATRTQLPQQFVEHELKTYARDHGITAKRLEGRLVLFSEQLLSSAPVPKGAFMPFMDTLRGIFRREESAEKKMGRLAEQRTLLQQQRVRVYETVESLEEREAGLVQRFAGASETAQQRIASEIADARDEIRRRHQLLSAIDKKLSIVQAASHKLELEQTVSVESLDQLQGLIGPAEELESGMAALDQLGEEVEAMSEVVDAQPPKKVQGILDELRAKSAPREGAGGREAAGAAPAPVSAALNPPASQSSSATPNAHQKAAQSGAAARREPPTKGLEAEAG
jgi:hypothetical protein